MKMIQIRNVPDPLHRKLKSRAAQSGMSLSDYLLREIGRVAEVPTIEEMLDRIDSLPRFTQPVDIAAMIRKDRDSR